MASKLTFTAYIPKDGGPWRVEGGRLREECVEHFGGQPVKIIIQKTGRRRTPGQNKYWWKVVVTRVMEGMNDAWGTYLSNRIQAHREEVHRFIMRNCWADDAAVCDPETGAIMFVQPVSIADLTTKEQMELNERVQKWALENLNIVILPPEKQAIIEY